MSKTCELCGESFEPSANHSWQRFCSTKCNSDWTYRNPSKHQYECQYCHKIFTAKHVSRNKYCSRECAFAHKAAKPVEPVEPKMVCCKWCNTEFKQKHGKFWCSDECRKASEAARQRRFDAAKKILVARPCKHCRQQFTPEHGNKRRVFCSEVCQRKAAHKNRDPKFRGTFNSTGRKKLRAFYGDSWEEHYEPVSRLRIYERDGWKCQICGRKLKLTKEWAANQATVDHIAPLAHGGEHKRTNMQAACMKCNSAKGDTGGGQLRLIG